jgi:hypothetical protein
LTDDYEGGNPLSGSGVLADDYGERSSAELGDFGDDRTNSEEDDERGSRKRQGEGSYRETQHGAIPDGDSELDRLSRQIRKLQDAQGFRLGYPRWLDAGERDDPDLYLYTDASRRQRVEVSWTQFSREIDWVSLDVNDPLLDIPFPGEPGARLDQTGTVPLGTNPRWQAVHESVEFFWSAGRQPDPIIDGFGYDNFERAEVEADAIRDITLRLMKDGETGISVPEEGGAAESLPDLDGLSPEAMEMVSESFRQIPLRAGVFVFPHVERIEREVRQAQERIFGEETRGGARERGPSGRAKRLYPRGHLSGPMHRFDFRARDKGLGKKRARDDAESVREWLGASLVSKYGQRWIKEPDAGPFSLDDYRRVMKRGRKDSEAREVRRELAIRARELKDAGAFVRTIAEVVGCAEKALARLIKTSVSA